MRSKDEWFIIDDLEKFVESTRVLVFNAFGKEKDISVDDLSILIDDLCDEESEELEKTLSQSECMSIAMEYIRREQNKKTKQERYIINTKKYMSMIESFNSRMVSNILVNLTNKGLIESAYDEKLNDFVFWCKDDQEENNKN